MSLPISLSTKLILEAANQHGVSWEQLPKTRVFRLQYQSHVEFFNAQIPSTTTAGAYLSTLNKVTTRGLLELAGIAVAKGYEITQQDTEIQWLAVFAKLTKPLVVKPTHGQHGDDVFTGIVDEQTYLTAVKKGLTYSKDPLTGVLVEEMFEGKEYRILATQEKIIGIVNRVPANVVGDGQHTIKELVELKNRDPQRGDDYEKPLLKIVIDEVVKSYLTQQQLTLDTIPTQGQQIFLRTNSNLSTGGDSLDFTDLAHPSVAEIALKATRAIPGLALAGVDMITTDITQPQTSETYIILEINSSPGIDMHAFPYQGKNREPGREFLYLMFPELKSKILV